MKKIFYALLLFFCSAMVLGAQEVSPETLAKRAKRRNLSVKEWNVEQKGSTRWLDHHTIYDKEGRKVEETEFASYGQRTRVVTEYGESGLVCREVVYDDRNKVTRIRKYEYNPDGTRKCQYNYLPSGKLYSVKTYEYIFTD